ncbi:hypothetical protein CLOL250_02494 [Clostridium sp. L2-50]|nr:hypothetical protein CLOL250_02494 [Clostridium sp. L2-50]
MFEKSSLAGRRFFSLIFDKTKNGATHFLNCSVACVCIYFLLR